MSFEITVTAPTECACVTPCGATCTKDFGILKRGDSGEVTFTFHNTGTEANTLEIGDTSAGWDDTPWSWPNNKPDEPGNGVWVIDPDATLDFKLQFTIASGAGRGLEKEFFEMNAGGGGNLPWMYYQYYCLGAAEYGIKIDGISTQSHDWGEIPRLEKHRAAWITVEFYLTESSPDSISIDLDDKTEDWAKFKWYAVSETWASYRSVTDDLPDSFTLTAGSPSAKFRVEFDPSEVAGDYTGFFKFLESNYGQEEIITLAAEAITEGPKIALIPEKVALTTWRNVIKDMCGVKYKIEIKNIGDDDLIISSPVHLNPWANQWKWLQESGDKPVSNDLPSLPQTVTAGSTISWHLQFCPTAFGRYWGEWTFYSNAINKNPVMLTALGTCWPAVGMGCTPEPDPKRDPDCSVAKCPYEIVHGSDYVCEKWEYLGELKCFCSKCGKECKGEGPVDETRGSAKVTIKDEDIGDIV